MAMALAVAALWTCIALERAELRHAAIDAQACAQAMEQLRPRTVPVSEPHPFRPEIPRVS